MSWCLFLLLVIFLLQFCGGQEDQDIIQGRWQDNIRPKLFAQLSSRDYQSFSGILLNDPSAEQNASSRGNRKYSNGKITSGKNDGDYFTTMLYTNIVGDNLLVGAKNILYKLNAQELRLTQTLRWSSLEPEIDNCLVKGKTLAECQNYIKVLQQYKNDPSRYLICGTNAYKPQCRQYVDERGSYTARGGSERSGIGVAPFSYKHNSTAVLVEEELFAGTVADFTGVDPIVFRDGVKLRTQQYDSTQLNNPDFVGSFEHEDYVYFFFREAAVEYINCGKAVFSRVSRVCKNDKGGSKKSFQNAWTSFLKTRLNCSVPGDYPFHFNEIQGVSKLVRGRYGVNHDNPNNEIDNRNKHRSSGKFGREESGVEYVLYATFTTPANSIGGSAVCAFRLKDIADAFNGKFKEQRDMNANWQSVPEHKVPTPRPGSCMNDTKTLPDSSLNFIKTHTIMDETVSAFFGAPIVVRTGILSSRFTAIAVDPQIMTTAGKAYDIVFIGTTRGRVLKVINAKSAQSKEDVKAVLIEELQLFSPNTIIKELKVMNDLRGGGQKSLGRLAVMSENEIRSFSVQRCDRATSCEECVALQDPYCAWDVRSLRCSSGDWTANMAESFIQSIEQGVHAFCPSKLFASKYSKKGLQSLAIDSAEASEVLYTYQYLYNEPPPPLGEVINIIDDNDKKSIEHTRKNKKNDFSINKDKNRNLDGNSFEPASSSMVFSLETLIITVSAGAVAALVLGFVTGYCCGRRCNKDDLGSGAGHLPHMPAYADTEYEYFEQRGGLMRPTMTAGGGMMGTGVGMVGHHQLYPTVGEANPHLALGGQLLPAQTAKLDNRQEEVTYAEPELVTGVGIGGGSSNVNGGSGNLPANSRYVGLNLLQNQPSNSSEVGNSHYSSSLLNNALGGPNKFNTIHSSVNKNRVGRGLPNSDNHYESATGGVVGGSGLKDYTRIGEGGGPLLALREKDFLHQLGGPTAPRSIYPGGPASHNNAAYHLSTLGRSGSARVSGPFNMKGNMGDPSFNPLLNRNIPVNNEVNGDKQLPSVATSTSVGGSTSSSSGTGNNSLNSANDDGTNSSLRHSGGKKHYSSNQKGSNNPILPDSAYGTNRSSKKAYL